MRVSYDTIVIGGSQAGLAMGYFLQQQGRDFLIVDAGARVGDAWRNRYECLRLFTPAKFSSLPGLSFPGDPYRMPVKDEMADYLENYAAHFNLPIRLNTRVDHLHQEGSHYCIDAGNLRLHAANVVVATGGFQTPKVPDFADELDPSIHQLHSSQYRNAETLPPGEVLVVGVGNSGGEIALDLARSRRVWLAGEPPGLLPELPHPRLAVLLFFVLHTLAVNSHPLGRRIQAKFMGKGTPLEGTTEEDFEKAGIHRLGRVVSTQSSKPLFADKSVLDVPNIIWATGYGRNFSWIDLPVFNSAGEPIHQRGLVPQAPGLYFLGLPFQYAVSSALIGGIGRDAKFLSRQIASRSSALQEITDSSRDAAPAHAGQAGE